MHGLLGTTIISGKDLEPLVGLRAIRTHAFLSGRVPALRPAGESTTSWGFDWIHKKSDLS